MLMIELNDGEWMNGCKFKQIYIPLKTPARAPYTRALEKGTKASLPFRQTHRGFAMQTTNKARR